MVANLSDIKLVLQDFLGKLDHSHLNDHEDIFKGAPTTAEVISQVRGRGGVSALWQSNVSGSDSLAHQLSHSSDKHS